MDKLIHIGRIKVKQEFHLDNDFLIANQTFQNFETKQIVLNYNNNSKETKIGLCFMKSR